jgi:hypothetical protein
MANGQPDIQMAGLSIDAEPGNQQAQPQSPGIQMAGGGFDPRLIDALDDPWVPEGTKAVLEELFKQRFKAASPGNDEFGITPIYLEGPDGNLAIMQMSKSGGAKQVQLPQGYKLAPGVKTIDLGTGTGILDRSGTVVGVVPKDVAGEAAAKEQGTSTGKAVVNLPGVEEAAGRAFGTIDDLLNDPALPNLTGAVESRTPTWREDTARAESKLKLIQGQVFLQAYNDLRGAGQISEQEGQAAKEAYSRLQATGVSDADFVDALHDYRIELQKLVNVARAKAGQPPLPIDEGPAASPDGSPKPGDIEDGYRFKGGDPADRNNWEPVS